MIEKPDYVFFSDCEGPISKNDNAFELTSAFIPEGEYFFKLLSKYDDILAYVVKRPKYRAGYTLKMIAPFLKAYGVTNKNAEAFSKETLVLIPGAKETINYVQTILSTYIISTSYGQYISAVCEAIDFPFQNTRCTNLNLDKYSLSDHDRNLLIKNRDEIVSLPMLDVPEGATSIKDLSEKDQNTVRVLDRIFWELTMSMFVRTVMFNTEPLGGEGKAEAVLRIVRDLNLKLNNAIYVGDSITDVDAMRLVKSNGGLSVSFNGNKYAVQEAEIAIMSEDTLITKILIEILTNHGKGVLLELLSNWNLYELSQFIVNDDLRITAEKKYEACLPIVELVMDNNVDRISEDSSVFRKTVRGERVGKLG